MSAPAPQRATELSRMAEIRIVTGREIRTYFGRKSTMIVMVLLFLSTIGGILAYSIVGDPTAKPYRIAIKSTDSTTSQVVGDAIEQAGQTTPQELIVSELGHTSPQEILTKEAEDGGVDMVLDLSDKPAHIIVNEHEKESLTAVITSILQQASLTQKIIELGGDPRDLETTLNSAVPTVDVLKPSRMDQDGYVARLIILFASDILIIMTLSGGGQAITMGVIEEKSNRIVEILLACVRPTSLLAGKVIGIGIAVITSFGALAIAGAVTTALTGIMPKIELDLNTAVIGILIWMVLGYAVFSLLFAAAGSLFNRIEDMSTASGPVLLLVLIPYFMSFAMLYTPDAPIWRVLAFIPPFSVVLMPARLALGTSGPIEQIIAIAITLVVIPLLVKLSAVIYTRAITRTGSRVPLREVLRRSSSPAAR